MQTDDAIREIKEGGEETLKAIYRNYRDEFLSWAQQHFTVSEDDAADIFQDAVIVFYKNVLKGKITNLDSTIKTYLFGICIKMLMKHNLKQKKLVLIEDSNDPVFNTIDLTIQHNLELNERQETIKLVLKQLTESCLKIIQMFYYKQFSMEAIKLRMGYKSEEVARTTKKNCMKKLVAVVKEQLGEDL